MSSKIDHVISIEVDKGDLLKRLTGRRTCRQCGARLSRYFFPVRSTRTSATSARVNYISGTTTTRIRSGIVWRYMTPKPFPLIQYYQQQGLVRKIEGVGSIQQIFETIAKTLA